MQNPISMINKGFLRVAAVASCASAVTTLLLIFLPEFFQPAEGFEGRMARVFDPAYRVRAWVYLVHPFLVMTAALGVAFALRPSAPVLSAVGLLAFGLWAFTEAGQQTLTLFAFDKWRVAYATADEGLRTTIRINSVMYDGLWDAMYVLLLIGFAIGNASFGAVLISRSGLSRIVGGFLIAACVLTVLLFMNELGWPLLPGRVAGWMYPAIQPLGRVLMGVWLWRMAGSSPR
ncbi:MAG TPA: hypothetical protein VFS58_14380 [Steroidobacteraceae bacterium]|nr:hypothetical protein [Steroidobacteraceae bacterium]